MLQSSPVDDPLQTVILHLMKGHPHSVHFELLHLQNPNSINIMLVTRIFIHIESWQMKMLQLQIHSAKKMKR